MSGNSPGVQALPRLVAELAEVAGADPVGRKVVVGPRRGVVRELLRQLARSGTPWVGFEPSTPLALAHELVAPELVARGLNVADEFDELALIDEAIDAAVAELGPTLRPFVEGVGLRAAMANSIQALRLAGIDSAGLSRAGFRDRNKREALARVLAQYERLLWRDQLTDNAGVLRLATETLRAGVETLPPASYLILPGQDRRGLSGRFLELLVELGARVLGEDAVHGLTVPAAALVNGFATASSAEAPAADESVSPSPASPSSPLSWLHAVSAMPADPGIPVTIELFAAGSVSDEVREVLRRITARELAFDRVEIIAVDPMTYGAAIDSLARRLGIPVTYASGLPVARTRPGRAVAVYLRWVRDDLAEDILREAIERGDIVPPSGGHGTSGPALARRLRRLRIGRGRERYEQVIARGAAVVSPAEFDEDELTPEEAEQQRESDRRAREDLLAILRTLLEAAPPLPPRTNAAAPIVSPAALANGLHAFMKLVPPGSGVDAITHERLMERLERLAKLPLRPTTLEAAIAIVAAKLETRVPASNAAGVAPWSSAGGCLHVSDVEYGGCTGRPVTFIVGLDAVRFPGMATHDTLLGDEERRRLLADSPFAPVPTTRERLEERRWHLARLLARLRGHVTLSYSAWEAAEARTVAPAAEMLQALRLIERRPTADYEQLHDALKPRASAVPRTAALDAADVWLGALAKNGVMLAGTDVVRAAYPGLHRGLLAHAALSDPAFTAHQGRIRARPGLDPRNHPNLVLSAKRLETLGACPLRYLLRYVLGVRPPEEAELSADRWLTPLERGRLLHSVYHRTLKQAREHGIEVTDAAFDDLALRALEHELETWQRRTPPPGDAVFAIESQQLRDDVTTFVRMTRALGAPWVELELRFGQGLNSRSDAVRLELPGGVIRVAGAIDRIDQRENGLVVIDYKTGSAETWGRPMATFHGGRRLQHALYSAVARRLVGDVARAEYHFPTHRGEARVHSFEERALRRAQRLINAMLEWAACGHFFPTDNADDCRYCDYRAVCRVRDTSGRTHSPMAEWTKRSNAPELELLPALRKQ